MYIDDKPTVYRIVSNGKMFAVQILTFKLFWLIPIWSICWRHSGNGLVINTFSTIEEAEAYAEKCWPKQTMHAGPWAPVK